MVRFRLGHLILVVMERRVGGKSGHILFRLWALGTLVALVLGYKVALADESGVSIWLPGTFGSFAAVPVQPGFQWSSTYPGFPIWVPSTRLNAAGILAKTRIPVFTR